MLKTLGETISLIESGHLLHISASVSLLKKLPKGNWIAGSTEFFLTPGGGLNSDDMLEIYSIPFDTYKICDYGADGIGRLTEDAYRHGFTLIILPAKSDVFMAYAKLALENDDFAGANVAGWASGAASLHSNSRTMPITASGKEDDGFFEDRAVALHVFLPPEKNVNIGMINIFSPKADSPVINFETLNSEPGCVVTEYCLVDGEEKRFADFLTDNNINIRRPLITDSMDGGINVSIDKIADGKVHFCAPVFSGVDYRFSDDTGDYAEEFKKRIKEFKGRDFVFSCNCVLNYIYGELNGKDLGGFYGPVCYGEIARKLLTQTLVYIEITESALKT